MANRTRPGFWTFFKGETWLLPAMAAVVAGFAALVLAPQAAAEGVRKGLDVCMEMIVPSLFPFLTVSGLLGALGLPRLLGTAAAPLMNRLFGVPGTAAAPFLLGLTGGYPVGAAATAELVKQGELSPEEGERLLPFCNNTGPAFILGAAGGGVFHSARAGLLLYLSHVLAAAAVGILFSRGSIRVEKGGRAAPLPEISPARALTDSVRGAVRALGNICGFALLFSALTALIDAPGYFSLTAGRIAAATGAEPRFVRALLTGILELGGGIASMNGLSPLPRNLALASFLLGFGSLSVHCQTLACISGTGIRAGKHFAGRLLHGLFSAAVTWLGAVGLPVFYSTLP